MRIDPLIWGARKCWERRACRPRASFLRLYLAPIWTRFHSLPMSKRYAESESEQLDILNRHNAIASELFEVGEPIVIYRSHRFEQAHRRARRHQIFNHLLGETMTKLPANPNTVRAADDDHYCVRVRATTWKPNFFDDLVHSISKENETGISVVSPKTKNIYSPYGGGMDTFSNSPESLEQKFPYWQSSRADKL